MRPTPPQPAMVDGRPTVWFASPGDPDTLTGGYIYNARVVAGLRASGWNVHALRLADSYPFPTLADQTTTKNMLFNVGADDVVIVDGLALGAFSVDVLANIKGRLVALVHHPLAEESGLSTEQAAAFEVSEKHALSCASGVIVTSPHTAITLSERYGVASSTITVAVPGIDRKSVSSAMADPSMILSVGSVTPRKGHDVLVAALARIVDLEWNARIVGSLTRDPHTAQHVQELVSRFALDDRIELAGERAQSELDHDYRRATILALATRHEGYGMVFSEAMMHGVPIVTCSAGAVSDTVPDTAGLLVPPDDVDAFAKALRRVLSEKKLLQSLSTGSHAASDHLPTWNETVSLVSDKLSEVAQS